MRVHVDEINVRVENAATMLAGTDRVLTMHTATVTVTVYSSREPDEVAGVIGDKLREIGAPHGK